MAPLRQIRRSRRLSHKSPVEVADYDWQGAAASLLLHSGSDVQITPSANHLPPPSPSACTTTSSNSPPSIVTHLPFTPGSSHTRNRKEGHIPRPPNAFMVFRSWLWNKDNLKNIERDNRNVSRIAGRYWNELSEAERAPFRYSPASQKKPKVSQRRSQRSADVENERCKKVADILLGGVISRDLAKYLGEDHEKVQEGEEGTFALAAQETSSCHAGNSLLHNRGLRSKMHCLPLPSISTPPSQYAVSPPALPATEEGSEAAQTPRLLIRTPELVHPPLNVAEEFVATDDIPYLSLDSYNDSMVKKSIDDDLSTLFPSHLEPGAHSVFSGVKPEATSFVDSCVLGAYTAGPLVLPAPVPFTDFDIESYSSMEPALVPFGSPVFSNPFESSTPTAEHSALLGTLDQLFGQPISPLTPIFYTENW
ncbi:hypothetical protein J3R83DRAFT_6924 [Lanmaoa asiatica]|nr:hypothetical protein J3R83DRAFT_6924 [Lanmaoa asiatica]